MPVRHQFSFKARCCDWAARHNNTRISELVSNVDVIKSLSAKVDWIKSAGRIINFDSSSWSGEEDI